MGGYLCLCWTPGEPPPSRALAVIAAAEAEGWTWAAPGRGWRIAVASDRPPMMRPLAFGRGVVIGDLNDGATFRAAARSLLDLPWSLASDAVAACGQLCAHYWGGYVAVISSFEAGPAAVFRDPTGAREAVIWRCGGLDIVTDTAASWLLGAAPPPDLDLDWRRVGGFLADPARIGREPALSGLRAVAPGDLAWTDPQLADETIWRPARFAAASPPPRKAGQEALRAIVGGVVAAQLEGRCELIAEISGGLDSAVVAGAIVRARGGDHVRWLHHHPRDRAGDERRYARAVAGHFGLILEERARAEAAIDPADWARLDGVRPALNGLDAGRDAEVARLAAGAGAIITGQGGDAVFFQPPDPAVLVDRARQHGVGRQTLAAALELSGRTRRSIWSLLGEAGRAALGRVGSARPASFIATASARDREERMRLAGLDGGPAKRAHVAMISQALTHHGESLRGRAAPLIHPLLAQPVVELCLTIPAFDLAAGTIDRAFVREAFADRLPPEILRRASKGEMSAHYGRTVVASLPALRPHLLEGRLVAKGLIDRRRLEALLHPDELVWRGEYVAILMAGLLESWVRVWEQRIAGLGQATI